MSFSPAFSSLIPCFSPPTFYLSFFTAIDDKLILGKFILTFRSWYISQCVMYRFLKNTDF